MTEGMTTRYKALEDSISKIADQLQLQNAIISKFDTVMSTFQQHSESIAQNFSICEGIQKSVSAQQIVITDMMHKLSHLEKQPTPPLLPTPTIPQLPVHSSSFATHPNTFTPTTPTYTHSFAQTSVNSSPINNPRLPELEIPMSQETMLWGGYSKSNVFFITITHLLTNALILPLSI